MSDGVRIPVRGGLYHHLVVLRVFIAVLASVSLCGASQPPAQPVGEAAVERVTVWRQAGVTSLALGNGVDVHLRPMARPGPDRAAIAVLVPAVELDETPATRGSAMLAIDALKAAPGPVRLRIVQRPEGLLLTATCSVAELPGALKQVATTLTAGELDPAAFEQARARAIAQSAAAESRTDRKAAEAMLRLMTPADDARLRRPARAQLEAVKLDGAAAHLRRRLLVTAVDVAVVGDVDPGSVGPAAAVALGVLPARARDRLTDLRAVKRLPPRPGEADAVAEGPRPLLTVSLPAPAISDIADSRLSAVAARLMERQVADALRESGLTVSLASGAAMTGRTYPDLGAVIGSFTLSGDETRLRGAAGVARARITGLVEKGPTKAQLERAAAEASSEIARRIETADYWSQSLAMAWFLRVPVDELGTGPAMIDAVTPKSVREHMAKWWKGDQIVTVTIVPHAAGPVPPAGEPHPPVMLPSPSVDPVEGPPPG